MARARDIIVIGASAGGVGALKDLVRNLDPDLPAALFVVLHLPANHRSHLAHILSKAGPLPAFNAVDGQQIEHGRILIAPPDFHLLMGTEVSRVVRGPRVNRSRPAIDVLFQTAAAAHRSRVIGVVLSGLLDDGTVGLAAIKRHGGYAIVQDPAEATFDSMPGNAIANVAVDRVLPTAEIGKELNRLVVEHTIEHMEGDNVPVPEKTTRVSLENLLPRDDDGHDVSEISPFTCPECSGTLWSIEEGSLVRYQCRVGHAFTPSNMLAAQVDRVEGLLWSALRAMEEREAMYRLALERSAQFQTLGLDPSIQDKIDTNGKHADMLREILIGEESSSITVGSGNGGAVPN